jgi:hypothetical protein
MNNENLVFSYIITGIPSNHDKIINGIMQLEEVEEGSILTEQMDKPLEESEVGPTSIDVTDEPVSI